MKKNSRGKYILQSDEITMEKFLCNYLGAENIDCSNLYHSGLRSLQNPLVIGISNSFAEKNPEYVMSGEILKVIDARNNLGSYINPLLLINYTDLTDKNRELEEIVKKSRVTELEKLQELYNKAREKQITLEKLRDYEELIRSVSKDEREEKVKVKAFEKASSAIRSRRSISSMHNK